MMTSRSRSRSRSDQMCPNDDPYFTRTMYRIGLLRKGMTAEELVQRRKQVYYTICIAFRALLIAVVYYLRSSLVIQFLVLLGAVVGITELLLVTGEEEPFELVAVTLHVIVCPISAGLCVR